MAERTAQLQQAQRRLLQADRLASLGQLAASVAHEINNPLSGVLNFSALMGRILKEDGVPRDRVAEFRGYLDRVTEQTARAGRIVSDLLAFSRRSKPQRAPADLNALVQGTVALVSHKLKLLNVTATLELDETLPAVPCDASQLQQVVLNLVMNGAEATRPHGSGKILVRTGRTRRERAPAGRGRRGGHPAKRPSTGSSTPSSPPRTTARGSDSGWPWSTGSWSRTGAAIEVQTSVGRGTTFDVTLPLLPDPEHRPAEVAESAGREA